MARQARAYPGFCSRKWLGVFLLSQDYSQQVSCPRSQHDIPRPGLKPGTLNLGKSSMTILPPRSDTLKIITHNNALINETGFTILKNFRLTMKLSWALKVNSDISIKLEPITINLSTRLWETNPANSVFFSQSLVLRSIGLGWTLVYRNWSSVYYQLGVSTLHWKRTVRMPATPLKDWLPLREIM